MMLSEPQPTSSQKTARAVTVILNPVSCPLGVESQEEEIGALLAELNCAATFRHTDKTTGAFPPAQEALAQGTDLVIAAGGDGTIMEALNALIGQDVPLGVIPLGTGNLLALNLGIPLTLPEAVKNAVQGTPKKIDVVRVNNGERCFAIMGGIGFDAQIMIDTPREAKRRFGRISYVWTALRHLRGSRFAVSIQRDDAPPIRHRAKCVLLANLGQIGPGVCAFPDANPDDGLMRVGIVRAASPLAFARLIFNAVLKHPAADPMFDVYEARRVTVSLKHPQPIEYDGDPAGETRHLVAEVVPAAVTVMVP